MSDDATLLNELMPVYDVAERHETLVRAAPDAVYSALREADMASGLVPRILLALRALPGAILSPRATHREREVAQAAQGTSAVRLANFERHGFRVVAERAPEELVIGVLGRFWTATGRLDPGVSRDDFIAGPPRGWALAGWSFRVIPLDALVTELRTETRVWCAPDALLKFRAYWLLVRPGSGLIRRAMLKSVRRYAEARTAAL
jgi:hypothetical protein